MIRSILSFTSIGFVTVVYALTVIVHMVLFRDPDVFFLYARSWSRVLLRLAGVRVLREGAVMAPSERYIYVANHASLFDIPVLLATIPDNIRIMYKRELERIPVFGWCLRLSPFIAIDRDNHRDASARLDEAVATMRNGSSVAVFPEGTRSADGTVGPFKRGAFTLAARSGRPLVPVALVGTAALMPARTRRLRPGTVRCVLFPPVTLPASPGRSDEIAAMQQVRDALVSVVNP